MQKLADIKGLSDAKVEKLLEAARKLCPNHGWLSAKTVEQQVLIPHVQRQAAIESDITVLRLHTNADDRLIVHAAPCRGLRR